MNRVCVFNGLYVVRLYGYTTDSNTVAGNVEDAAGDGDADGSGLALA
jgi:hypothetical protein